MKRADVWKVSLQPRSGSEQRGVRPAIRHLTTAPIPAGESGLSSDSVALCHEITALDRGRFLERLGILAPETMARIEIALLGTLDLRSRGA